MRVRDLGTDLMVDDNRTFDRWIGVGNFVIGSSCAALGLWGYQPGGDLRDIFLILMVPFAVAIAGLGVWRAAVQPATKLHIDGVHHVVTLVHRTAFRHAAARWTAGQIARFARRQRPGRDGEPVFRLCLELVDGRSVTLSTQWQPDPTLIDGIIARGNALIGK
jgi:type III secretory pathway component EscS